MLHGLLQRTDLQRDLHEQDERSDAKGHSSEQREPAGHWVISQSFIRTAWRMQRRPWTRSSGRATPPRLARGCLPRSIGEGAAFPGDSNSWGTDKLNDIPPTADKLPNVTQVWHHGE